MYDNCNKSLNVFFIIITDNCHQKSNSFLKDMLMFILMNTEIYLKKWKKS